MKSELVPHHPMRPASHLVDQFRHPPEVIRDRLLDQQIAAGAHARNATGTWRLLGLQMKAIAGSSASASSSRSKTRMLYSRLHAAARHVSSLGVTTCGSPRTR